jgi:hypothetical protein
MWNPPSDTIGASGGGGSLATAGTQGDDCKDPSSTGAHGGEAGWTSQGRHCHFDYKMTALTALAARLLCEPLRNNSQ